jgi:hypothetical protein
MDVYLHCLKIMEKKAATHSFLRRVTRGNSGFSLNLTALRENGRSSVIHLFEEIRGGEKGENTNNMGFNYSRQRTRLTAW